MNALDNMIAQIRAEMAEREITRAEAEPATGRPCTICGQPSGRAAVCWACFVAGDDEYRRRCDQ